jgi:hypothetical protein
MSNRRTALPLLGGAVCRREWKLQAQEMARRRFLAGTAAGAIAFGTCTLVLSI